MRSGVSAGAKSTGSKTGKRKKRFRVTRPDAAQALGDLTAFIRREGGGISAAMDEAFGSIPDRHEQKCIYGPTVLGWAMTALFLFRFGSVNAMDAVRGLGSYPAWLREVCGLDPHDGVQAPCGEDLRHWAERVPIDAVNEILFTGFETVALRQKRLEMGRLEGHILFAVDGTGRDNCRDETTENGKKRRVALVGSVLAPWGKVPIAFEEVDERDWVRDKADCELRAFKRMARRLKERFSRLKLCLVGDALYACRTLFEICEKNGWRFIATFKEGSWKDVAKEVDSLMELSPENRGHYNPKGWRAHRRDAAGGRVPTVGQVRWAENVDFGARNRRKDDRYRLAVVECDEKSPMKYHGRFVTNFACRDANDASALATCGRKRWWIESQNRTQKHLGYGLEHNYCNKPNASKVLFAFLLLASMLWECFYKLGLRHWQPGTGKVPERTWVRLIWAQLVCGSESWRNAKGQNLKRA